MGGALPRAIVLLGAFLYRGGGEEEQELMEEELLLSGDGGEIITVNEEEISLGSKEPVRLGEKRLSHIPTYLKPQ